MFVLEPHFGCCTANFNQSLPKFVLSSIIECDQGLAVNLLTPFSAQTVREGKRINVRVRSEYPFRDDAVLEVTADEAVELEISVRIPGFVKSASVDGEKARPGSYFVIRRRWEGTVRLPITLNMEGELVDRPGGGKAYVRGPLVFSLPVRAKVRRLEYVRDGVERKFPYCDYEMLPDSPWNYGFCSQSFESEFGEIGEYPFSPENPPLRIKTRMVPVAWEEKDGICGAVPEQAAALGEPQEIFLQPYGCTDLRMTEMPFVEI